MSREARRRFGPRSWKLPPAAVGCFFLWTGGIHVGIVAADPYIYRHFADGALIPGLRSTWQTVFMSHPSVSGLTVALGEVVLGLVLMRDSQRWRRIGWSAAIAFQVALMCFGWGFWMWSVPALALLAVGARADRTPSVGPWSPRSVTVVDRSR